MITAQCFQSLSYKNQSKSLRCKHIRLLMVSLITMDPCVLKGVFR